MHCISMYCSPLADRTPSLPSTLASSTAPTSPGADAPIPSDSSPVAVPSSTAAATVLSASSASSAPPPSSASGPSAAAVPASADRVRVLHAAAQAALASEPELLLVHVVRTLMAQWRYPYDVVVDCAFATPEQLPPVVWSAGEIHGGILNSVLGVIVPEQRRCGEGRWKASIKESRRCAITGGRELCASGFRIARMRVENKARRGDHTDSSPSSIVLRDSLSYSRSPLAHAYYQARASAQGDARRSTREREGDLRGGAERARQELP